MKLMSFPLVFHPGGEESSGEFRTAAPRANEDRKEWLVSCGGRAGGLLSVGPYVGGALGGEFSLAPTATPEPGTLILFGSGILDVAVPTNQFVFTPQWYGGVVVYNTLKIKIAIV